MKIPKAITIDSAKTVRRKRVDARVFHRKANARMIPKIVALQRLRRKRHDAG